MSETRSTSSITLVHKARGAEISLGVWEPVFSRVQGGSETEAVPTYGWQSSLKELLVKSSGTNWLANQLPTVPLHTRKRTDSCQPRACFPAMRKFRMVSEVFVTVTMGPRRFNGKK